MESPIVTSSSVGMQILIYLLIILMLLISLTIHELGHFTFAKIFKVNVKEFSIGVGPCLARRTTKQGMRVSLRLIPMVAYVMLDSSRIRKLYEDEKENKDYKWWMAKPPKGKIVLEQAKIWQYLLIMFGGVLFNFTLFLLLYAPLFFWMQHLGYPFAPFQQIGTAFVNVGKNMIFRGGGDVFDPKQIDAIIKSKHWVLILFFILSQMNLITFIFNIIPLPPLDGWKILSYGIQKGTKKEINEKVELIMTLIVLVLFIYIFVSGIICDFIH